MQNQSETNTNQIPIPIANTTEFPLNSYLKISFLGSNMRKKTLILNETIQSGIADHV